MATGPLPLALQRAALGALCAHPRKVSQAMLRKGKRPACIQTWVPRVVQKHLQLLYGWSVQEAGAPHLRDVVPTQVQHFQGQVSL